MDEITKDDLAGKWFVWIGQSATTGSPNIKTGRLSRYGTFISLPSRSEAKKFETDYFDRNGNCQACACTVNTGRLFAFGLSSTEFMIDLVMAPEVENFSDYKKGY